MRTPRPRQLLTALLAFASLQLALATHNARADEPAAPDAPAEPVKPAADPVAESIKKINEQDNGLTINREQSYIDVKAEVCLRSAEFLEMFVCTRDTREHESILVTDTQPSMIHLALLLLGAEPGKPLHYDRAFDPPKLVPATGPKVQVFVVIKVNGQDREIPANRWVQDNKTEQMMKDNTWLFAGSVTANVEEKPVYLADLNGSAVSLVNFGDDTLTLPNEMTQDNLSHGKTWAPRTKAIPKVGTDVILRLRTSPAKPNPPQDNEEAEAEAE